MLLRVLFRVVLAIVFLGLVWKMTKKNVQPEYSTVHDHNKNT